MNSVLIFFSKTQVCQDLKDYTVGDQEDLLDKVGNALILKGWQERTGRAFDYASEQFEIGKIARRYEKVYFNLL